MCETWSAADLSTEYCGFMVAIMVERCKIDKLESNLQFSPVEIATILNSLPGGSNRDFNIDADALHQEIHLFKRFLISRGFSVIEIFGEDDRMKEFYLLGRHFKKGYNLKFPQYILHEDTRSMNEISDAVIMC